LFVAANFQHSPANMGYFSLIMPTGHGPGWWAALAWNIVPAGLGNMAGGAFVVALPFWYALGPSRRRAVAARHPDGHAAEGPADSAPAMSRPRPG
jgi:formate/nitrite transporter FocA (FNT family)